MRRTPPSLEERVARLERMVAEIHAQLAERPTPPPPEPEAQALIARANTAATAEAGRAEAWAHRSEQWLGRVGLALLFLGLVYLFNYSIDLIWGWITPTVRVAIGLSIGAVLLGFGLRLHSTRPSYSQILLAGALAVFYVSGFAAFTLYHLVSYGVAFAYMSGVMVLAVVLARRQDHPSLASLGALGGFATPLLLHRATPAVTELSMYSALVVGWTGWLYWLRGWPVLLWTYAAGGIAALSIAVRHATGDERWMVQSALLLVWISGAAVPFVRGVVHSESRLSLRRAWGRIPALLQLRALGVGTTSAVLLLTDRMWALADEETGVLFVIAAALYALFAALAIRQANLVAGTAAPVAAALCATGTFLLADDSALRVALLGGQALLYLYLGHPRFPGLAGVGHLVFALLGTGLLLEAIPEPRVAFDRLAYAQLAVLVMAVAGARLARHPRITWAYYLGAHFLFLVWLAKELGPLGVGTGAVTLAWGSYGVLLLLLAFYWRDRRAVPTHELQLVALSALACTVVKLLVVDLERVAIIWRICLFMGFGASLLTLSSLFKPRARTPRDD